MSINFVLSPSTSSGTLMVLSYYPFDRLRELTDSEVLWLKFDTALRQAQEPYGLIRLLLSLRQAQGPYTLFSKKKSLGLN